MVRYVEYTLKAAMLMWWLLVVVCCTEYDVEVQGPDLQFSPIGLLGDN